MKTRICCTTDFEDNLLCPRGHDLGHDAEDGLLFTEKDIEDLMAGCARMGAERHEWILGNANSLYDTDSPLGFDLLQVACDAAHRHGMRFDVVFKPFEGGGHVKADMLPLDFPRPAGVPLIEERDGLLHGLRPFVAEHPEMRLERAPADMVDPGGPVAAIRLIQHGTDETGIRAGDLAVFTSRGGPGAAITRYEGPMTFDETIEYRPEVFEAGYKNRSNRVLTLGGLTLPEEAGYVLVRCEARGPVTFWNHINNVVELADAEGRIIPSAVAPGPLSRERLAQLRKGARRGYHRYLSHPEVRRLLEDEETCAARIADMNRLRTTCGSSSSPRYGCEVRLGSGRELVVMRGKPRYFGSLLNPIYPEVRKHWLDHVRFCIDRGVDGVNIRVANHNWPPDPWAYGFNPPTLAGVTHPDNTAEIARSHGTAFTNFLRDAAGLLHAEGKELGVHVNTAMLYPDQRPRAWHSPAMLPWNIDWQWPRWIEEIADYAELRDAALIKPETLRMIVDRIGLLCREAGKRFVYQSSRGGGVVSFEGPYDHLEREIDTMIRPHPDIAEYNFYETADFTRFDSHGKIECSPGIAALARRLRKAN